jgi:hypothetical protein
MVYYHSSPVQFNLSSVGAMAARCSTAYQLYQRYFHEIIYPHEMDIYKVHHQMRRDYVMLICIYHMQVVRAYEKGLSKYTNHR